MSPESSTVIGAGTIFIHLIQALSSLDKPIAPRHACSSAADASSIQFVMPFGELLPDDDRASRFLVLSMRHLMVWAASFVKGLSA